MLVLNTTNILNRPVSAKRMETRYVSLILANEVPEYVLTRDHFNFIVLIKLNQYSYSAIIIIIFFIKL